MLAENAVYEMDALDLLRSLPDASVDAIVTDPPYAEVDRDYGRLSEDEWRALMYPVTLEMKRVLKPSGSAVVILQPNSERVGVMRSWLWRYLVWCCDQWNVVQDAYWWNHAALPSVHSQEINGMLRPSVAPVVWLGSPDCYRDQDAVLWLPSRAAEALSSDRRARQNRPSGWSVNEATFADTLARRGGVTPFNLLPIANTDSSSSAGAHGHGAGTPAALANWWIRYICPAGGLVVDPFFGTGTMGIEALKLGRAFIGGECDARYAEIARQRIAALNYTLPLLFAEDAS